MESRRRSSMIAQFLEEDKVEGERSWRRMINIAAVTAAAAAAATVEAERKLRMASGMLRSQLPAPARGQSCPDAMLCGSRCIVA